jgi:putative transposase
MLAHAASMCYTSYYMKLIAQIRLNPTPEQHAALLATLAEANAACDAISLIAWQAREFRRIPLQKLSYHQVKDSFQLGAQVLIRCIAKVADAYKLDCKVKRTFRPHGAIAFDDRNLSWYTDKQAVSIWTVEGRQHISYRLGTHQRKLLASRKGESDLVYHKGAFYLLAVCDVPEPDEQQIEGVLGVDLGMVNLATDSDGEAHSGGQVDRKRDWYARRRAALQAVSTKSAKRRLRQLSGRQRRFQKDTNHRISKRLVAKAERTKRAIAVEELTHIRTRTRARGPKQRARHSNWAFAQLRQFISYKARLAGMPVAAVHPRNTSRTCSVCGHCEKANRRSQAAFCCVVCGHQAPADVNAAINIRNRAECQTAYGVQPSG